MGKLSKIDELKRYGAVICMCWMGFKFSNTLEVREFGSIFESPFLFALIKVFIFNFFTDALGTRNLDVMCMTLKILQQLVMASDLIGPALVPFYRQLLPMFNAYKIKNCKSFDKKKKKIPAHPFIIPMYPFFL